MPPNPPFDYLVGYLMDAGPTMPGGMQSVPLPYSELRAWSGSTATPLSAWEARTMRTLSAAFLYSAQAAEDIACPAPFTPKPIEEIRQEVAQKVSNAFRSLMGKG